MIVFAVLIIGCFGWITVFVGWWIPSTGIPLVIGGGLFILLLLEVTFLHKRGSITWSALLTYANIALGCWIVRFWHAHGYPSEIIAMRFFMLVAAIMSAILVVVFIKVKPDGDRNRSQQNDKSLKSLFKRKKKDTEKEVTVILGESAEDHKFKTKTWLA